MIIFPNVPAGDLDDRTKSEGKAFQEILELVKSTPWFKRLYWGRQVETPENVQLHIGIIPHIVSQGQLTATSLVRENLESHSHYLLSSAHKDVIMLAATITSGTLTIRHAQISEFNPGCKSLGKGAPVTGTAIFRSVTLVWDHAWALWVSIEQHVPGFLGIAGGHIIESVDGHENCFIALVGWENVEVHDAYHHTKHFYDRRKILLDPAEGKYNYYGHLALGNSSSGVEEDKAKL